MQLDEGLRHALDGHSVLFLGSGFSVGVQSESGVPLTTGAGLTELLAHELGLDERPPLDQTADLFREDRGVHGLIQFLRPRLTVADITSEHLVFARAPWRRIYTTNYDNAIEFAYTREGKNITPVTLSDDPQRSLQLGLLCVHLNGYVYRLDQNTIFEEFKLTSTAYLSSAVSNSRWGYIFREDIVTARSVIFVGYSMADLDIARIVFHDDALRAKCIFVTSTKPTDSARRLLSRFGSLAPIGTAGAANALELLRQSHVPSEEEPTFFSFTEYHAPAANIPEPSDNDVFDLLIQGKIYRNLVFRQFVQPQQLYYVMRSPLQHAFDAIESGARFLFLHSDLGNGKTLLAEGIAARALQKPKPFRVFYFARERTGFLEEVEYILTLDVPVMLIFEEYHRDVDRILRMISRSKPTTMFLLTDRTAVHRLYKAEIARVVPEGESVEIDVNVLAAEPLAAVDQLLLHLGFWRGRAGLSANRRIDLLRFEHKAEFQSILLAIIEAPQIMGRFDEIFRVLESDNDLQRAIVCSLVLRYLNMPTDRWIVAELIGVREVNAVAVRANPAAQEMIGMTSSEIVVKSSIFSRFILSHLPSGRMLIGTLKTMLVRAAELGREARVFRDLERDLMRFSTIEGIMPTGQRREVLINYYETIKNMSPCAGNPLYWLQYAIARLSLKDYAKARNFLDQAYGLARKRTGFSTYQIDNQCARYLLEECAFANREADSFKTFIEAERLLRAQIRDEVHKHYPFRVAAGYKAFYERFQKAWTQDQRKIVVAACAGIRSRIDSLDADLKRHPHVEECREAMEAVLAEAGSGA